MIQAGGLERSRPVTQVVAIADRTQRRAARTAALARTGVRYRAEFAIRGAFRFSERREACERLIDGDAVTLEREPENRHDPNAILVLGENDCELGLRTTGKGS